MSHPEKLEPPASLPPFIKQVETLKVGGDTMALVFKPITPKPSSEAPQEQVVYDLFSFGELKVEYPKSFNSWKNMKARVKDNGGYIHESIRSFKDFLNHLGPCEKEGYTLDRINNKDPEYAPGKVRWADKKTQNSNKSDNILVTYDGESQTIAQWAEGLGVSAKTLYWRKKQGWSDDEIIEGKEPSNSIEDPFPQGGRDWEKTYADYIIHHGYLSKLAYLFKVSQQRIAAVKDAATDLQYHLDKLDMYGSDEAELSKVKKELEIQTRRFHKCQRVITEVGEQLRYEKERDFYFNELKEKNLPPKIRKESMVNYCKTHPRPEYTINTPQFKTKYPE
jgi:hypothetical protein